MALTVDGSVVSETKPTSGTNNRGASATERGDDCKRQGFTLEIRSEGGSAEEVRKVRGKSSRGLSTEREDSAFREGG